MRIAVSGTHFSGKSTLVASLLEWLPSYTGVDEPYFLLEQEGYEFSHPPLLEDFEEQLKRSVSAINESEKDTVFDRCPLDCLAYMLALSKNLDEKLWAEQMEAAIEQLDLIIFLPIEYRDRIIVPPSQNLQLRLKVDEKLAELILDDSLGILESTAVLEVTGGLEDRVKIVKEKLPI
jgi:hypothetical protein